jgi:hypothetical protein
MLTTEGETRLLKGFVHEFLQADEYLKAQAGRSTDERFVDRSHSGQICRQNAKASARLAPHGSGGSIIKAAG